MHATIVKAICRQLERWWPFSVATQVRLDKKIFIFNSKYEATKRVAPKARHHFQKKKTNGRPFVWRTVRLWWRIVRSRMVKSTLGIILLRFLTGDYTSWSYFVAYQTESIVVPLVHMHIKTIIWPPKVILESTPLSCSLCQGRTRSGAEFILNEPVDLKYFLLAHSRSRDAEFNKTRHDHAIFWYKAALTSSGKSK